MTGPTASTARIDGYVPFPEERIAAYVEAGRWRNQPFHAILDAHAVDRPDAPAVVGPDRSLTYVELAERTRQIASGLFDAGVGPHDRVAIQLPNCVGFLEAFFACSRVGAIPVLLLPRHREREARHLVELTGSKAVVTVADPDEGFDYIGLYDDLVEDIEALTERVAVVPDGGTAPPDWTDLSTMAGSADPDEVTVNPNDPGLMMLSGGTSGLPKAIPRTHNDYAYLWEHIADRMAIDPSWTLVPGVPLPHSFAFGYIMGAAIWAGATVAVEPRLKPLPLMNLIDR
ncbi:MAG: AMP-binding protein, partial [Halobacteriales archaeon]|nr:AMP-binding protein [Halobacteriales archaeon]